MKKKTPKLTMMTIEAKVPCGDTLRQIVDAWGIEKTLKIVCVGGLDHLSNCTFPSSYFAKEEDVHCVEYGLILKYVFDNKDKILKEAEEHWKNNVQPKLKNNA